MAKGVLDRTSTFHQYAANDKKTHLQKELTTVKEGDVIGKEENCPRGKWKLGHVKELIKGGDNQTRGAVLSVVGNKSQLTESLSRYWHR